MAHSTFVIVIECGKRSTTIGPYHSRKKADDDLHAFSAQEEREHHAWVEPVVSPEQFRKEPSTQRDLELHA